MPTSKDKSEPVRFTIVTDAEDGRFLDEALASLTSQTFSKWEWLVGVSGSATAWKPAEADERVVISPGAAVWQEGSGEFVLPLGEADRLSAHCLEEMISGFEADSNPSVVYGDFAYVNEDGSRNEAHEDEQLGWIAEATEVDGTPRIVHRAFDSFPQNIAEGAYAPKIGFAFRRTTGEEAEADGAASTHEMLCRLYLAGPFVHLPDCVYLRRTAGSRTLEPLSVVEPDELFDVYGAYIERLALAWAAREGLKALDLGAAHQKPEGYLGVDQYAGDGIDIVCDVTEGIPLPDSSVGVIRASDFLEHIPDKIAIFNELYRLLAHGGILLSRTPSTDGRGAFQDPTHVAFYNENSFWYFTEYEYAIFVPPIVCKFQISRMSTDFPSNWHVAHNVSYVFANLISLKDGPRQGGYCSW